MSLRLNVHRICNDQRGMDGAITAPSLLSELRDAVVPGPGTGLGDGAAGAPSPVNVGALDLLQEITTAAVADLMEWKGYFIAGQTEDVIQALAHADPDSEWGVYLEHVTLDWCDRIDALLRPTKPRRKLMLPCPSCGERFFGPGRTVCLTLNAWGADEVMLRPAEWDLACGGCDAAWRGENMVWLLKSLESEGVLLE